MSKKVVVIGGGPAGMESATYLANFGFDVSLIEKENAVGGKLNAWDRLFPSMRPGGEVKDFLIKGNQLSNVNVMLNTEIEKEWYSQKRSKNSERSWDLLKKN